MYTELETLLNRKNQRLVCCDNEWPVPGPHRHIAYIRHDVEPPVDAQTLDDIRKQVGDLPEILAFYQRYGSVRLYADTIGDGSAFFHRATRRLGWFKRMLHRLDRTSG
ncbi:MAG: hypothetical protein IPG42_16510 [Betaproteobacteria bacterium]|nr:hypothetical protein [Betaproteobacteria bacterium]